MNGQNLSRGSRRINDIHQLFICDCFRHVRRGKMFFWFEVCNRGQARPNRLFLFTVKYSVVGTYSWLGAETWHEHYLSALEASFTHCGNDCRQQATRRVNSRTISWLGNVSQEPTKGSLAKRLGYEPTIHIWRWVSTNCFLVARRMDCIFY